MLHTTTPLRMAREILTLSKTLSKTLSFFKRGYDSPAEQIPVDFGKGWQPLPNLRGGADCMAAGAPVPRHDGRLR